MTAKIIMVDFRPLQKKSIEVIQEEKERREEARRRVAEAYARAVG